MRRHPVSDLAGKRLGSCHSYSHNKKKAKQTENQQLLMSFRGLRSQDKPLAPKLENRENKTYQSRNQVIETSVGTSTEGGKLKL